MTMVAASLKSLAASLLLATAPLSCASAVQPRQQQGPGRPWVSIDAQGEEHTFTRHITTINGVTSTVDAQPYSLTGSVFTYIATNGATSTRTGNPPPPRATDSSGGKGYFLQCMEGSNSNVQPFCQPRNEAKLYVNIPYYITWDRNSFSADLDTPVHIQGFKRTAGSAAINDSSVDIPFFTLGFENDTVLGQGYYIWEPTDSQMDGRDDFLNLTLRLAFNSSTTNEVAYRTGATISLHPENQQPREVPASNDDGNDNKSGGGGVPAAAIAVPIVIIVLIAAAIAAFFFIRKRRRAQAAGAAPNRGSSAFGNRGSAQYNQKNTQDIELTTSPTSPRGQGGNVFQQEIERQNRERGA